MEKIEILVMIPDGVSKLNFIDEVWEWAEQNTPSVDHEIAFHFDKEKRKRTGVYFIFTEKKDAMLFKLRWGVK